MTGPTTLHLQGCLDRLRAGDAVAREELLRHSQERLRVLTHRMLGTFSDVRRWEETDDVLQQLLLRLNHMLGEIEVGTVNDYLRLAATNLRRVLLDLARHYNGPHGLGADSAPAPRVPLQKRPERVEFEARTEPIDTSGSLDLWARFHEYIEQMAAEDRELFDLLWYHQITHEEAAQVLGLHVNTVRRRWQLARIRLMESLRE